jgi:hypothetical protein
LHFYLQFAVCIFRLHFCVGIFICGCLHLQFKKRPLAFASAFAFAFANGLIYIIASFHQSLVREIGALTTPLPSVFYWH